MSLEYKLSCIKQDLAKDDVLLVSLHCDGGQQHNLAVINISDGVLTGAPILGTVGEIGNELSSGKDGSKIDQDYLRRTTTYVSMRHVTSFDKIVAPLGRLDDALQSAVSSR